MEQQLNSSTGFWANDDQRDEDDFKQLTQTDAKPLVKRSADDVIKICKEALSNAGGAYNALRLLGAERHLPGLGACEKKRDEALEAIEGYLHCA